jgi:hypothetical protein
MLYAFSNMLKHYAMPHPLAQAIALANAGEKVGQATASIPNPKGRGIRQSGLFDKNNFIFNFLCQIISLFLR